MHWHFTAVWERLTKLTVNADVNLEKSITVQSTEHDCVPQQFAVFLIQSCDYNCVYSASSLLHRVNTKFLHREF